jgi:hypothetical protein
MSTKHTRKAGKPALKKPPTTAALAAALEITGRRVSQLKLAGMPVHSVAAAQAWRRAQHGSDDSAAELRRRRIALLKQQERRARIEADQAEGKLMSRAEAEQEFRGIAYALNAFCAKLENEIPPVVLGLTIERSRPAVKKLIREMQVELGQKESEFWKNHPVTTGK